MAVQIPNLKRVAPVAPTSVGRVETQVPSLAGVQQQVGGAIEQVGKSIVDYAARSQRQAIKTRGNELVNNYETWYNEKVHGSSDGKTPGLKHSVSNPAELYNQFDNDAEAYLDGLMKQTEGMSDNGRGAVRNQLLNSANNMHNKRVVQYGSQNARYKADLKDSTIKRESGNLVTDVKLINLKDLNPFAKFDDTLGRIQEPVVDHAEEFGGAVESDGVVKLDQSTKTEIGKATSKALVDAIENTMASKNVGLTETLLGRYKHQIDPHVDRPKLIKKFEELKVEQKGFQALDKMEGKTFAEKNRLLRGIKDIEVRTKALEMNDANERRRTSMQKRASDVNYNAAYDAVVAKQGSSDPFTSVYEMQNDPAVGKLINGITEPSDKRALDKLLQPGGKVSDPTASIRAFNIASRPDVLYNMKSSDVHKFAPLLSKGDFNTFRNLWLKVRTESESGERSKIGALTRILDRQMRVKGLLKKGPRGDFPSGLKRKWGLQEQINQISGQLPANMSPQEMEQWVGTLVDEEVIRKKNEGGFFSKLFGGDKGEKVPTGIPKPRRTRLGPGVVPRGGEPTIDPSNYDSLGTPERLKARKMFKKEKGRSPKSLEEFKEWFNSKDTDKEE